MNPSMFLSLFDLYELKSWYKMVKHLCRNNSHRVLHNLTTHHHCNYVNNFLLCLCGDCVTYVAITRHMSKLQAHFCIDFLEVHSKNYNFKVGWYSDQTFWFLDWFYIRLVYFFVKNIFQFFSRTNKLEKNVALPVSPILKY